ncbi:hypothetical protein [Faecalibacillus intestinalis]|uniref:hypothetical protein n=2 Tax=Faecalibacillus intestinalis TaxID=1982626 RepID=UPI0035209D59
MISSVISFLVMEFMQTYDLFGNEMAYAITIINFIIVSVMKKEIKFYNFIPCIFSQWISVFTSTIVLFFFKVITNYNIENIIKLYRIPIIFLARILFFTLIVVLNYFKSKIKNTIIEKNKYLLTITMVLIFGIYFILLNDIGHMHLIIDDIYLVLLLLTVLFFVVCILFIHMTRLYNEKTEYVLKNKELEYIEKNKSLVHYLHDNVMKIQHSLRYGLILIENNIDDQKYEDAKNQVEHFYDLLDEKTNIMTNNYIFDTLLNDYIFLIKSQFDTKVKLLINIGNDSFFKDFNNCDKIINTISNFFEQSDKTYLEIKLIEHEAYVQLDLFVENKENNIDKINQDMNVEYFEDYAHLKVIFDK